MDFKQLESIFIKHLDKNKKITDITWSSLVGPGENNGGELFKLEVSVKDENTKKEVILQAVGKTIHSSKEFQEIFNIQVTFRAEILFYEKIVPALQSFQRENGVKNVISCFPKCYGGRLNLNDSDTVDRDSVIILENLISAGFNNLDRHVGYNLKEAKLLLKDLAEFQSTVIALKVKKPEFFFNEIRPLCDNHLNLPEQNPYHGIINILEPILLESKECGPLVPKIRKIWDEFIPDHSKDNKREPFATIVHCDLWVNNAMMKYINGEPVKNKFLDFQLYNYGSPGFDVLNFLFTSVQTKVLEGNFESLLRFYHDEFVDNLKRLKCDIADFTFVKFLKELALDSAEVLNWDLSFIPMVVFGKKGEALPDLSKIDFNNQQFKENMLRNISVEAKERLCFMVEEYKKRNWL